MILRLVVLLQFRLVTDGQTDTRRQNSVARKDMSSTEFEVYLHRLTIHER